MLYGMYTLYDRVAEEAGPIFISKNDAVALRSSRTMLIESRVQDPQNYAVMRLGDYNTETLVINALPVDDQYIVTENKVLEEKND